VRHAVTPDRLPAPSIDKRAADGRRRLRSSARHCSAEPRWHCERGERRPHAARLIVTRAGSSGDGLPSRKPCA
jgi:hypothetical protein